MALRQYAYGHSQKGCHCPKHEAQRLRDRKRWLNPEYRKKHKQLIKKYAKHPDYKARRRREHLRQLYGLTIEQFNSMLTAQDYKCLLCQVDLRIKMPTVDHDHKTGVIRGILCKGCNWRLGRYENVKESIVKYLDSQDKVGQ